VASLDELVDNLDIDDLVGLCETARAQYVIFTVYHANLNTLYPSKVLDKYLPGHTSKRDAIGELVRALKAKNIKVILYYHPSVAHDLGPEDAARMDVSDFEWGGLPGRTPENSVLWNNMMNELLAEYLERYGAYIDGFFVDGGIPPYVDAPRIRKTIKEYDENIWIIQNAGLRPELADFANNEDFPKDFPKTVFPLSGWIRWFPLPGSDAPRAVADGTITYNPESAYRYTVLSAAVSNRVGGGVNWGLGPFPGGRWEPGVRSFLEALGVFIGRAGISLFGTQPSTAWITADGESSVGKRWAALESKDGKTTYLHIFIPSRGLSLTLPPPADGRRFTAARLFTTAEALGLVQDARGVTLTLSGGKWDDLDTIVILT
jgi:hypothetical protein